MQSKSLLIAIAALALTATGVQAYGGKDLLRRAGLSEAEQVAFEEARQLREDGDYTAARGVLEEAGVTEETLEAIRKAARDARQEMHMAVLAGDFAAFKRAIVDTPLEDLITTEADFQAFVEAHELKNAGKLDEAQSVLDDLGIQPSLHPHGHFFWHQGSELTSEQRDALSVAKQANDREAVQAILEEAGVDRGPHWHR
ncbi:MAG: hypothetical protein AAB388_00885 [Patescibacteria group bacterium]